MGGITPQFGIRYPNATTKAAQLGTELGIMGDDIERALLAAEVQPVTNQARIVAPSAAARDAYFGTPATEAARLALQATGAETVRTDKGWTERYYATYSAVSNPAGAPAPGWYPVAGRLPSARVIRNNQAKNLAGGAWYLATETAYWTEEVRSPEFAVFDGSWTVPIAGVYRVDANLKLGGASTMLVSIKLNDATTTGNGAIAYNGTANAGATSPANLTREIPLNVGDKLRLGIFVPGAMSWDTDAPKANFLGLSYVRPV